MYKCGNKVEIGDCVFVDVSVMVTELNAPAGTIAMVLEKNIQWSGGNKPLISLLFSDETIQQLPASWCTLCQRK